MKFIDFQTALRSYSHEVLTLLHIVFQCHGLSIEGFVLPSSTTREVRSPPNCQLFNFIHSFAVYFSCSANVMTYFSLPLFFFPPLVSPPDDAGRDQVLRPRGDGVEPCPSTRVPAAAGGGHPGAHHAG